MSEKDINAILREPFPEEMVGKLPRVTCRDCRTAPSRVCQRHKKSKCEGCGSYITSAHIHLDYVGHAAVTDRLLQADPNWTWEPLAFNEQGAPLIEARGDLCRMWIRLTVGGVTRLGVGTCETRKDDIEKELIGDALRNAAMRFGVAIDLWSKEGLSVPDETPDEADIKPITPEEMEQFEADIHFAESMSDLAKVAKEIKQRGVSGDDRQRLMDKYEARRNEINKEAA